MLYDFRPFFGKAGYKRGWQFETFWGDCMEPYIIKCESGGKRMGGTAVAQVANQGDIDPVDWHGLTYCIEVKQSLGGVLACTISGVDHRYRGKFSSEPGGTLFG